MLYFNKRNTKHRWKHDQVLLNRSWSELLSASTHATTGDTTT
jgi:hypothetical protein